MGDEGGRWVRLDATADRLLLCTADVRSAQERLDEEVAAQVAQEAEAREVEARLVDLHRGLNAQGEVVDWHKAEVARKRALLDKERALVCGDGRALDGPLLSTCKALLDVGKCVRLPDCMHECLSELSEVMEMATVGPVGAQDRAPAVSGEGFVGGAQPRGAAQTAAHPAQGGRQAGGAGQRDGTRGGAGTGSASQGGTPARPAAEGPVGGAPVPSVPAGSVLPGSGWGVASLMGRTAGDVIREGIAARRSPGPEPQRRRPIKQKQSQ